MYLSENIFGIDGLHDIGTVFFLIAIISLSMKKFMKKNNWTMSANHCLNLISDGRVEQNREFKGLIIWAVILFLRRKSSKTT